MSNKLHISLGRLEGGSPIAALAGIDLRAIIRRWIRGFHAALYREPLSEAAMFSTYPPLPEAKPGRQTTNLLPIPEAFVKFVEELKRNRATGTLDRIVCRNGKCRYECVWSQADDGTCICIYCLDLYNWIQLGDINNFEPRGCVGCYARPQGGMPKTAATKAKLLFKIANVLPFDPFGQ